MVNIFRKVARWALQKATGFPIWNAGGPWPNSVICAFSDGSGAEKLSTVYGCIRVRGQTIGSVPFNVYRTLPNGERELATDHWLYPILHDFPSADQTSYEWRECMERAFCSYGNAFSEITRVNGRVTGLNFLTPEGMSWRWDQTRRRPLYIYSWLGYYREFVAEDLLHVKNFGSTPYWGDSPLRSYAISHAMEAQDYGRYFLRNLGRPGGYLKFKGKRPANEEVANKMRADWQAVHGGPENAGKTGVLWEEGEYVPISIAPEEAQYVQTRAFTVQEIAGAIYGVPLNLIGQSDKTATYASSEQFAIDYVKHTARPQAVRYEQAIKKALLRLEPNIFCEMDLEGLQRGDSVATSQTLATLAQNGFLTRNEGRRRLNLPEKTGADSLTVQVNLSPLDRLGETPVTAPAPAIDGGSNP